MSGIGDCRRALSASVPDGIDFLVTPQDEVFLEDYFIDQYEVTIRSYQVCVDDEICNGDVIQYLRGFSPFETLDEPVRYISYIDAETYCEWRGGYIPTEAEWEYAARGPENLAFPWGNEFDGSIVNFCDVNCQVPILKSEFWDDGFVSIAPVTAHPQDRSWVGAIGMAGNVSEWTSTIYISQSTLTSRADRVVKGGTFWSTPDQTFLWRRFSLLEGEIREGIGFRCAKRL
jgi:formylglycine-generating enzyme required for sulfatase activity